MFIPRFFTFSVLLLWLKLLIAKGYESTNHEDFQEGKFDIYLYGIVMYRLELLRTDFYRSLSPILAGAI